MAPVRKNKPKKATEADEENERSVVSGQLQKKILKQQQRKANERGVVLIKHLPHGFFEEQLQKYFQQFGKVTRLRLVRSRRTGGSKSFAFVEFEYPEVAQVAADTMDNYLMFQKIVKATYIPPEKQAFNYFKSSVRKVKNKAGKEIYVSTKTAAIERQAQAHNNWSEQAFQKRTAAQLKKLKKLNAKFPDLKIDFTKLVMTPDAVQDVKSPSDDLPSGSQKSSNSKGKNKKNKKNVNYGPEILLGDSLLDDTKDEDFIPMPESDDELVPSSDEEEAQPQANSSDEEEVEPQHVSKRSKVDRFQNLTKRKTQAGGVQKAKKHAKKKPVETKAKASLKLKAAKQVAKPLVALKNKKSKSSKK